MTPARSRRPTTSARASAAVARATILASAVVALGGCTSAWQTLSRPEGDGGWDPQHRVETIERAGRAAGVAIDGAAQGEARAGIAGSPGHAGPGIAGPGTGVGGAGSVGFGGAGAAGASVAGAGLAEVPESRAVAPGANRPPSALDLPTALAMAARGNRRIAEADKQVEAAAARVMDVRGRLLPGTAAATRASWYTDAQRTDVDLPPGLLPPGTAIPVVTVRAAQNTIVNGTVLAPLDLSGEFWHALRAAQAGYRGEQARAWATTLEQQLAVVRAYYQLLEAIRLKEVATQTVEVYGTQFAIAEERYANGRLTKNDLLTFDVARKNAEQEVLRRDLLIERARWDLNEAIGADVNRAVDPVDERGEPALPTVDESLRKAWRHNPVLVSLVEEQQRLQETVTSLERSRLPRVNAGGAVDWQSQQILIPQAIGTGFVGFNWDVGTDMRRESQISAARIEADRNRVEIERQMRELEAAVRTAHLAAIERLEAWRTARSAVEQAEENLRIRRQQFDAGRAQSDDVLIAENLLSQQRATLATALYQAHVRRAELQRLIGLPIASE